MTRRLALALMVVLAAPAAADAAVCKYLPPPPRISKAERMLRWTVENRRDMGFRHDRAFVRRVNADPASRKRRLGYFPMTRREHEYAVARDNLAVGRRYARMYAYMRRHGDDFGEVSIEDDWPRGAYLRVPATRDLARHRRALRRFGVPFRMARARYSLRELRAVADRIDHELLEAQGIHPYSWGPDGDGVQLAVTTERPDVHEVVARLYGPSVHVVVEGPTPTFLDCDRPDSYEVSADGRTLTVHVGHSSTTTPRYVEVVETAYGIDLGVVVERGYVGRLDLRYTALTVRLAEPLGARPVRTIEYGRAVRRGRPGRG